MRTLRQRIATQCKIGFHSERLIQSFLNKEERISRHLTYRGLRTLGSKGARDFRVGEETMTEAMVLDLGYRFRRSVEIVTFTKYVENSVSGADWLWTLETSPSTWISMLVQAKRTKEVTSRTASRYRFDVPATQQRQLLSFASTIGVVPVYALYMATPRLAPCLAGMRGSSKSSIHLCLPSAVPVSPPSLAVNTSSPPGITFSELLCCPSRLLAFIERAREYVPGQTTAFDDLVSRFTRENSDRPIAGALKISLGESEWQEN